MTEIRKTRSAYKILMAKSLEKNTTGKTKDMEQNTEIDLREIDLREAGTWREMSQNQVHEHNSVHVALNGASEKVGQIAVGESSTSSISSGRDSVLLHV